MRKNKGLFFVVATLLAVTCLLVSCNSEVSDNASGDKGLAYITFDGGNSKRITQNTITESYELVDINELYWVYSATKADLGGASGQTPAARVNNTTGLSGVIGGFSKGLWNFTLTGWKYDESGEGNPSTDIPTDSSHAHYEKIFYGSVSSVLLNVGTQSNPDPINVNVNFVPEGNGTLVIDSGFIFQWQYDSAGTSETVGNNLKLRIDVEGLTDPFLYDLIRGTENNEVVYRLSGDKTEEVPADDYVVTASVIEVLDENTTLVYSIYENINVKIYAGQTTRITAEMLEGEFAAGSFNAIIESVDTQTVTASVPVTFTSSYTPASVTSGNVDASAITTVEFEADALAATEGSDSYKLTVAVSDFATAQSKFVVQDGTSAASLDLDLKKYTTESPEGESITTFAEGKFAVITSYIAKGLSGVKVLYNGEGDSAIASTTYTDGTADALNTDSGLGYNSATGYLSFKTNHFSEYYVSANAVEAINVRTNKVDTLSNTLGSTDLSDGDTVMLLKDIGSTTSPSTTSYVINKKITLDGNNKGIFGDGAKYNGTDHLGAYKSNSYTASVIISEDCTLKNLTIETKNQYASGRAIAVTTSGKSIIIDNCRLKASCVMRIEKFSDNNTTNLRLTNSSIDSRDYYGIYSFSKIDAEIDDCDFSGWNALYFKGCSNGSVVNIKRGDWTNINKSATAFTNDFSSIVFEDGNITVNLEDCVINSYSEGPADQWVISNSSQRQNCIDGLPIGLGDAYKAPQLVNGLSLAGNTIKISGEKTNLKMYLYEDNLYNTYTDNNSLSHPVSVSSSSASSYTITHDGSYSPLIDGPYNYTIDKIMIKSDVPASGIYNMEGLYAEGPADADGYITYTIFESANNN